MKELTNRIRKLVASLDDPRVRDAEGLFAAEGTKCVLDTAGAFDCRWIFATAAWLEAHGHAIDGSADVTAVKRADLERMSHLSTPPQVIAVYERPVYDITPADIAGHLVIALDRVQDPGNLGTVMRVADWFGIDTILCSHDTVDCFNPKVVQATMGAISRVKAVYVDLPEFLAQCGQPVYGTFLDGDDIYGSPLGDSGIIVMGNEGRGISDAVARYVDRRLYIPSFPVSRPTSESLNVGMATAITVAEFRRRQLS